VTAVFVVIMMTMLLGFAALTVDLGMLYNVRGDLQRSADSAALAGTMALLNEDRLRSEADLYAVMSESKDRARKYVAENPILGAPSPIANTQDVGVGYLTDPSDAAEPMDFSQPERCNAVSVLVRRDQQANGPVELLFARVFGHQSTPLTATATAAMMDGIEGFRVDDSTGNAGLLPMTLKTTAWQNLLDGIWTSGDNFSYDPDTGLVSEGPDGIPELNLFPGGGAGQLPPGNFGTVDIGPPDNATADISRQIREGVSQADLAYFGGELRLGDDGTLPLNGETGISAGFEADLQSIIGQPRTIPLFSQVSGPGNNAWFTITGFAGIRIMEVKLTGAVSKKRVIIQPALVVDDSAIAGPSTGSSYYVYQPVRLVR
jgi:hypothetical protein